MAEQWVEEEGNPLEAELRKAEENVEIDENDDFLTVVDDLEEQNDAIDADEEDDDVVLAEDDDDEDRGYHRKRKGKRSAKDRIGELTREKRELERQNAASAEERRALQERLDQIEKKLEANDGLTHQQQVQQFAAQYNGIRAQLRTAIEEGDTEKQLELTEALADMRSEARMRDAEANRKKAEPKREEKPANTQQQPEPPAEAMRWWKKNSWFNSAGFEEESKVARRIDAALHAEGVYGNDEPEYYEEMDRRLQKRFPELYNEGSQEPPKRPKGSAPARGGSGGNSKSRVGANGKLTFTKAELNMAKALGITTKEGLTEYARELEKGN